MTTPSLRAVSIGGIRRAAGPRWRIVGVAVEIHRVLHRPADAERLHARQRVERRVVEMRNRPPQRRNRYLGVHAIEHLEQLADGGIVAPVHGQRQVALRDPERDLLEGVLVGGGRLVVVVHAAGDTLADAVEAQHVVADAHRQPQRRLGDLLELAAVALRAERERHADGQLVLAPDVEQRLVIGGVMLLPPGSMTPVRPRRFSSRKNFFVPSTFCFGRRLRQPIEERDDRRLRAGDGAGERAGRIAFEPSARPAGPRRARSSTRRAPVASSAPTDSRAGRRPGCRVPPRRAPSGSVAASRRTAVPSSRRRR